LQGVAIQFKVGFIWVNEHVPKGGDDNNILQLWANYGRALLT